MSDVINVIEFIENYFVQEREKIDVKSQYDKLKQKTKVPTMQIKDLTPTVADSELQKVKDAHSDVSQEVETDNLSEVCYPQIDSNSYNNIYAMEGYCCQGDVYEQGISDSESSDEFYDAEAEVTKDDITVDADVKELESMDDNEEEDHIVLEKILIYPVKSCAGFEVNLTNKLNRGKASLYISLTLFNCKFSKL